MNITGRKTPTPNKAVAAAKTPCGGGDRFIPNRASSNFDLGHYKVSIIFLYVLQSLISIYGLAFFFSF